MTHTHACHQCGEVWDHATNSDATTAEFNAAHTCPNGHEVTVKYTPEVAAGLAQVCKSGGDAIAYLKQADPVAAITLEGEQDLELRNALDEMREAGAFFGEMLFRDYPKALQDKIDTYAQRLADALAQAGKVQYEH